MYIEFILIPFGLLVLFGHFTKSVEGCQKITVITVKPSFVQLGGNSTLFCKIDTFDTRNKILKWTRGENDQLLTFDSSSLDPNKFQETTNHLGFGLNIYNITKQDVNNTYTCSCGFAKKSITLQLTESKKPHNDATTANDTPTYGIPVIFVVFAYLLQ